MTVLKFAEVVHGLIRLEQHWKRCANHIQGFFDIAVAAMLARSEKIDKSLKDAKSLAQSVELEVEGLVNQLNIENDEKSKILDELKVVELLTGYPKEYFNDSVLENHYRDLKIYDGEFMKSVFEIETFLSRRYGERILTPVKETVWQSLIEGESSDSYYSYTKNFIFIHPKHLKKPFFSADLPSYINYAGLGCTVSFFYGLAMHSKVKI